MKKLFYCSITIFLISSCSIFESGGSNKGRYYDGTNGNSADPNSATYCNNSCASDEYCGLVSNTYTCISQTCMIDSDCNQLQECDTSSTIHQCAVSQAPQQQPPTQMYGALLNGTNCSLDSECASGICDPDINSNGTITTTKTCGRTSGGTNYGRGVCDTDCATECKSGQTLHTITVLGTPVCIISSGGICKYICAQTTGEVCYTSSTNYGIGSISETLFCKTAGVISSCNATAGNFGTCN